tara:strand:- start:230 stop:436 length:207 start_codon:yes stop_codon:yes gene_type:complete
MIGEPGDLPSRRSSENRGKFSVGGKAKRQSFVTTLVKFGLAARLLLAVGQHVVVKCTLLAGGKGAEEC